MSDKQCRFSAHAGRREQRRPRRGAPGADALIDVFYQHARVDPQTGWGDWADEVYTIYPDGTSVGDVTLRSTAPDEPHEWQESIVVIGPGFSPANSIEPGGVTLAGASGEVVIHSWKDAIRLADASRPAVPCIQIINTKSRYRPFAVLRPAGRAVLRRLHQRGPAQAMWPCTPGWNHWSAATFPSDGRCALAADRPSHSSLTHLRWEPCERGLQQCRGRSCSPG